MMKDEVAAACPDCGHSIDEHSLGGCAYQHYQEAFDGPPMCECHHSPSIIFAAQLAAVAQRERELRELAEEWRAYADGDYCQTYNKGAALALHRAANDIARLLASADGAEKE